MSGAGSGEAWRAAGWRWGKFSLVGAMGVVVQLSTLAALNTAGVHYLAATALAVEAAVLHNFLWHQNFTWRERRGGMGGRLARFHLTNGMISICGNIALMRLLVGHFGLPELPANMLSIAVCWAANFAAADRMVFLAAHREGQRGAGRAAGEGAPKLTISPFVSILPRLGQMVADWKMPWQVKGVLNRASTSEIPIPRLGERHMMRD